MKILRESLFVKVAALLMCLALLAGCGSNTSDSSSVASSSSKVSSKVSSKASTKSEADSSSTESVNWDEVNEPGIKDLGTFDLRTASQKAFMDSRDYKTVKSYATGQSEQSIPQPVTFTINWGTGKGYEAVVSKSEKFTDARKVEVAGKTVKIYNSELGCTYYCKVTGDGREKVYKFTTAPDGPRFIYVDGVTNIRDLGGWATADGKKVRQGMVYRGGRLNESCLNDDGTNSLTITDAGKAVMLNDLGIKSEIDLRMAGKSYQYENGGLTDTSVLGSSVNYYNCQMNYSGNIFTEHKASIKQFFVLLSDEANYPVYFHCSIGTDRTGRMAYLLGGLLGVDKSDLYMDYLCSNFGAIGSSRDIEKITNVYDVVLSKQPGSTLQQKIRSYLKSIGVTDQQMDSIVRILTEG